MSGFTSTVDNRYFEDYVPGLSAEYGPIVVEESAAQAVKSRISMRSTRTKKRLRR